MGDYFILLTYVFRYDFMNLASPFFAFGSSKCTNTSYHSYRSLTGARGLELVFWRDEKFRRFLLLHTRCALEGSLNIGFFTTLCISIWREGFCTELVSAYPPLVSTPPGR